MSVQSSVFPKGKPSAEVIAADDGRIVPVLRIDGDVTIHVGRHPDPITFLEELIDAAADLRDQLTSTPDGQPRPHYQCSECPVYFTAGTDLDLWHRLIEEHKAGHRGHRRPYVGEGADGARRSADIDRNEADTLDREYDAGRITYLTDSALRWERQAEELSR